MISGRITVIMTDSTSHLRLNKVNKNKYLLIITLF